MSVRLEDFLTVALNTPIGKPDLHPNHHNTIWGVPVNVIGESGAAKTSRIRDMLEATGLEGHFVWAGPKQPEDFTGVYIGTPDGIAIECVLPAARRCIDNGGGGIVLDEVNGAMARTQMAMLSFIDERQIGDQALPRKTRFVLIQNPVHLSTGGFDLQGPFANRMAHKIYEPPTRKDFGKFLQGHRVQMMKAIKAEEIVTKNWFTHWPTIVALAVGFVDGVKDSDIQKQPEPNTESSSGAWPSMRTWYMGWRAICAARCLQDEFHIHLDPATLKGLKEDEVKVLQKAARDKYVQEIEADILESLVGETGRTKWVAWVKSMDLPSPQDMLTKGWKPDTKRLDKTLTSLTSMAQFLRFQPKSEVIPYLNNAWKIVRSVLDEEMNDLVIPVIQTLNDAGLVDGDGIPSDVVDNAKNIVYDLCQFGYYDIYNT